MIVLQLDPASLGMWYGLPTSGDENADRIRQKAINAALRGDARQVAQAVSESDTEAGARRSAALASAMWHECRHFADIALTNFGIFKVRRYLTVYANLAQLLSGLAEGDMLHCPVTDYMSEVTRSIHGLRKPNEDVMGLLRDIAGRSLMETEDHDLIPSPVGHISVGGKAQLEAIAYLCQSASISEAVGLDLALGAMSDVPDPDTLRSNYGWVVALESLGLIKGFAAGDNVNVITGEPLVPLFFASLCTRHWGQSQVSTEYGGMGFPAGRLAALARNLGPKWRRNWPDWSEAWSQVNDVCESIWGRSAISELEEDVRRFGEFVDELTTLLGEEAVPARWAADLYKLRVALLRLLHETPQVLLHVEQAATLTGLLNVPLIAAAPHGEDYPLPNRYERLCGFTPPGEPPSSGWWWWLLVVMMSQARASALLTSMPGPQSLQITRPWRSFFCRGDVTGSCLVPNSFRRKNGYVLVVPICGSIPHSRFQENLMLLLFFGTSGNSTVSYVISAGQKLSDLQAQLYRNGHSACPQSSHSWRLMDTEAATRAFSVSSEIGVPGSLVQRAKRR